MSVFRTLRPAPPSGEAARAFTLIELLIVVAIIAILAAIAVPNFLEAQVRSKVSRVKSDMRSLQVAVESYAIDYNTYPYRRNVSNASQMPPVPDVDNRLQQMAVMTTPISYITSLPQDVFERVLTAPNNVIDYYDPEQTAWLVNSRYILSSPRRIDAQLAGYLLVSVGPDGYLGPLNALYGWPEPIDPSLTFRGTVYIIYDPTNGTVSTGNIYDGQRGLEGTPRFLRDLFGL